MTISRLPAGIEHFLAVAEARSFRAGARHLGLSPAAVSKAVARLEAELGARLLERSTRSVALTPEGEVFLAHCRLAREALQAGQEEVRAATASVAGSLRISLSPVLAPPLLAALPALRARHPSLGLRLELSDRPARLVEEEIDVALRLGPLEDSRLQALRLRAPRWVTVASPRYLAGAPGPARVDDLDEHDAVLFVGPSGAPVPWSFQDSAGGPRRHLPARSSLRLDQGGALVEAALAGLGVAQVFDFMVTEPLARGRLVEVLAHLRAPGPALHALCLPGRARLPRVRAVLDLAREAFGAPAVA